MEPKKATIRAQKPQALNCPRCNSAHTKFCYYNNYSLSQPRYFCKTCRRYWTEGGSLRNVPVGGGSRRNKRSSPSPAAVAASMSKNQHHMMMGPPLPANFLTQNPSKNIIQGQDLNLAYPTISREFVNLPYNPNTTTTSSSSQFSAMEFLKSGFADPRGMIMNSFPNTTIMNSPGLNFSLDGFENGGGYHHHHHHDTTMSTTTTTAGTSENARILFPFQDLKAPISTSNGKVIEPTRGQGGSSSGYWGGGESW